MSGFRGALVCLTVVTLFFAFVDGSQAGLVAHYPLDSISSGSTPDTTGVNGSGALNGSPTLDAAAKMGAAFNFTGSDAQYVGVSDPVFGKTAFTASVWMKPDALDIDQGPLSQWINTAPQLRSMLIRSNTSGQVQTYLHNGTAQIGGTAAFLPSQSLSTSAYSLVTVAYDGQKMYTYLNGEKSTTVGDFGSASTIGEGVLGTMGIGGRGSSERNFDGLIDDVSFFDTQLSDVKIQALYNVADQASLNYNASQADQLFQVFDGSLANASIRQHSWSPAADGTLTGTAGDVVDLGDGNFGLVLNAAGGGLISSMPASGTWAKFDVNTSANPTATQAGSAGLNDGDNVDTSSTPFSATSNGITLSVTNTHTLDRDRVVDTDLLGHPESALLRDFTFVTDANRMTLDLTGLVPNQEYIVRMFGHDATASNTGGGLWFEGNPTTLSPQDPAFLAAHEILSAMPDAADYDLRLTSSDTGTLQLTGRGAGFVTANATLALNGLEIFAAPQNMLDLIKVDVNDTGTNLTEDGFVPLTLDTSTNSGTVTDNGITVTITTDSTAPDLDNRDRANTGEALVSDFIFGEALNIQFDGLDPGREYELTIWSQDTDGNTNYSSLWYQDDSTVPFRAGFLNANNPNNLDAASFTTFLTANSSSMLIRGVSTRSDLPLVFVNGLQLRAVPEPGTFVLFSLGSLLLGVMVRCRRRSA